MILLDEARWSHRDHLWCHLISDVSLDELHEFARVMGLPDRLFHGDHYDLPEMYRSDAIAAGAGEISSRDLVRRLRAAGLRCTPAQRRAVKESLGPPPEPNAEHSRETKPDAGPPS